jgi:hypothetical protein
MDIPYSFKKTIYTEAELLKEFSLSRSYLYQIVKDWIDQGNDPIAMGKLPRMNIKNLWDPRKFLQWLDKNKFSKQNKYHTEEAELKEAKAVVVSINNNERKVI